MLITSKFMCARFKDSEVVGPGGGRAVSRASGGTGAPLSEEPFPGNSGGSALIPRNPSPRTYMWNVELLRSQALSMQEAEESGPYEQTLYQPTRCGCFLCRLFFRSPWACWHTLAGSPCCRPSHRGLRWAPTLQTCGLLPQRHGGAGGVGVVVGAGQKKNRENLGGKSSPNTLPQACRLTKEEKTKLFL